MTFENFRLIRTILAPALLFLCSATSVQAQERPGSLWTEIKQGGYVLMVRNTASAFTAVASPASRGGCVSNADGNEPGQQLAINLGKALRERAIPIARVLSSPSCVNVETAQLAFGQSQSWNEFEMADSESGWRARALSGLAMQVPANANIVLVTDKTTIHQLTDQAVHKGEILVLKPQGQALVVTGFVRAP